MCVCVCVCVHVLMACADEYATVKFHAVIQYVRVLHVCLSYSSSVTVFAALALDNNLEGVSLRVKQHVFFFLTMQA